MDKQLIERIALEVAKEKLGLILDSKFGSPEYTSVQSSWPQMLEFCTSFLARIDAERGKEAVAWFAFADNNGPVPLELWGFDKKECKHAVLENARSVGWKGTIEGYLFQKGWSIRPLGFIAPQQPPAPCPAPLDESRYCPDCEALQAKLSAVEEELEEWRMTNKIDELYRELDAEKATVAELEALSVTHIMLDVVPGSEGMGKEVYAKSVAEVEHELSNIYERYDGLESKVAELEKQRRQWLDTDLCGMVVRDQERTIAEQSALIEKCEKALTAAVEWGAPMRDAPRSSRPEWFDKANSVLAAIAAHRKAAE